MDRAGIWNILYMQSWREKRLFKVTSAFSEPLLCLPVFCKPYKFSCISWYGHLDYKQRLSFISGLLHFGVLLYQ